MVGACAALRTVGVRAAIVSMGRGQGGRRGAFNGRRVARLEGIPILYGPAWNVPLLSQLLSMAWLVAVAIRLSRHRQCVHLFYNQLNAYLPAIVLLRLLDRRAALDLEDGPVADQPAHATRLGNASPSIYARLINGGALLACSALAGGTDIRPVMPYYGCLRTGAPKRGLRDTGEEVRIFYSGYLDDDTGVALLSAAVGKLRASREPALKRLRIDVAGMGPGLAALADLEGGKSPAVHVLGRLGGEDYRARLRTASAGLSLKLAGGPFAHSTFPSKTVEYAEHGLALIATDISDVRALFGDAALYIERDDPEELAAYLLHAAQHPETLAKSGRAARKRIEDRLSEAESGRALAAFLFPEGSA
ncbi:MAG TPA: glycosyltransferase [Allosphingosinicella sp.]|nr:glycosyltransferase [Allosphingosinicella sp.]